VKIAREAALAAICQALDCAPVQHIGNILVLWRPNPPGEAKPSPNRRRAKPLTKKQAAAAADKPRRRKQA
jgi:RNA-binding protein